MGKEIKLIRKRKNLAKWWWDYMEFDIGGYDKLMATPIINIGMAVGTTIAFFIVIWWYIFFGFDYYCDKNKTKR